MVCRSILCWTEHTIGAYLSVRSSVRPFKNKFYLILDIKTSMQLLAEKQDEVTWNQSTTSLLFVSLNHAINHTNNPLIFPISYPNKINRNGDIKSTNRGDWILNAVRISIIKIGNSLINPCCYPGSANKEPICRSYAVYCTWSTKAVTVQ